MASVLRIKNEQGEWEDITSIKGADGKDGADGRDGRDGKDGKDGKDGAIQYTAGKNISIANNSISTSALNSSEVQNLIDLSIAELGQLGFTPTVVEQLPVTDIDVHTIYLVPKQGDTNDNYDEYVYVNNNWEHIGSTAIDLSNYYTKGQINDKVKIYSMTLPNSSTSSISSADYGIVGNLVTTAVANGDYDLIIAIKFGGYATNTNPFQLYYTNGSLFTSGSGNFTLQRIDYSGTLTPNFLGGRSFFRIQFIGNWNENVFTVTSASIITRVQNFLSTTNTDSYTPTQNYHPATKKYVDDAVSAIPVSDSEIGIHSDVYTILSNSFVNHTYFYAEPYSTSANFSSHGQSFLEKAFNDMAKHFNTNVTENILKIIGNDGDGYFQLYFRITDLSASGQYGIMYSHSSKGDYYQQFAFDVSLVDDTYTISSLRKYNNINLLSLGTNNTQAYTPKNDYQPATKKYVDDTVASMGGGGDSVKLLNIDGYNSSNNALVLSTLDVGVYLLSNVSSTNTSFYFKARTSATRGDNINNIDNKQRVYLVISQKIPETYSSAISFNIYRFSSIIDRYTYTDYGTELNYQYTKVSESVLLTGSQTITGTKTFSTLPQSSATPTSNNQLVNKKYVDDTIASSGGADGPLVKYIDANLYTNANNALDMSTLDAGVYILKSITGVNAYFYMKPREGASAMSTENVFASGYFHMLVIPSKIPTTYDNVSRQITIWIYNSMRSGRYVFSDAGTRFTRTAWETLGKTSVVLDEEQTITGKKTFTVLPESSVTPTTNNQLVNKTYVDSKIWTGTQAEYDALSTHSENTIYFIKDDTNGS